MALGLVVGAFQAGASTAEERFVPTQLVVVRSGDTLWSIAAEAAGPDQDVQAMVLQLQRINALSGPDLQVGEVLEVPR
ncbi:MAG: LysM peptidoglycan-binding domain-containing protein [Propionibacteriaceae bacterium]|jgi:LysM repeat protein|nr:LysM peptidoglycan-binding domain-containing protein [Propionibacteriaceae bacterium]